MVAEVILVSATAVAKLRMIIQISPGRHAGRQLRIHETHTPAPPSGRLRRHPSKKRPYRCQKKADWQISGTGDLPILGGQAASLRAFVAVCAPAMHRCLQPL